jgi:hypothetical protein
MPACEPRAGHGMRDGDLGRQLFADVTFLCWIRSRRDDSVALRQAGMPCTSTRPVDAVRVYFHEQIAWSARETLTDGRCEGSSLFSTIFFSTI